MKTNDRWKTAICLVNHIEEQSNWLEYSSWFKLVRITAYCKRFIDNCKSKKDFRKHNGLTAAEQINAEIIWIRIAQERSFHEEIHCCINKRELHCRSPLQQLSPFLDEIGVLRVGGRLHEASMSYDKRHPIIVPHNHKITKLIVRDYHLKYLHAGPQLLMSILRSKFWITKAKGIIHQVIHSCTQCFRKQATLSKQLMGSLPLSRIEPARPFMRCGVDYAGPILIKNHKGRGKIRTTKAYICIFVCFTTRAIHIELVGDLTTQSFIAGLCRFTSRRGKPSHIHSDNGTNFTGANHELKQLYSLLKSTKHNDNISSSLAEEGIQWHFNPPSAPHFGGLWEAGVKSIKHHLRRTIGLNILIYEELLTVLTQIEACLNSRPMCPLSSEPEDLEVLTPWHLLIGQALVSIPDQEATRLQIPPIGRWQLIQQIVNQFWRKWSREYCSRLQHRPKWTSKVPNLTVGTLVLLKENNTSPLQWPMARIIEVHPGNDLLVRTVTLKTMGGIVKRPIAKCCRMPVDEPLI